MIPMHHLPEYSLVQQPPAAIHQNEAPTTICKGDMICLKLQRSLSLPLKKRPYCAAEPLSVTYMCIAAPQKVSVARGPKAMAKVSYRQQMSSSLLSPLKTTSTTVKKSVRFANVQKTRFLKKCTLTDEYRHQLWYQRRDYAEIDQDCAKTLQALQQVDGDLVRLNHDEYCVRGLEMKTSPHIHRLRRLRGAITVRAVLDAQAFHKYQGVIDQVESLAAVSLKYTTNAQTRARELGVIDSFEASRL
jgi:hypothetical protein